MATALPLAVVNPAQVRAFGRATGRLAKTDRLDTALIAHFAEAIRPGPRPVASSRPRPWPSSSPAAAKSSR